MTTWRLLAITIPLTVAAIAWLGVSAAILLGAVIAPTNPVLASEVQLAGPSGNDSSGDANVDECNSTETTDATDETSGDDDPIRFALASEAGLTDGLAFPITNLAIAVTVGCDWFVGCVVDDVIVKLSIGLVVGCVLGRVIGRFTFRRNTALACYGFLTVFTAAVTLRQHQPEHSYHATLHDFADPLERIADLLFLLTPSETQDRVLRALVAGTTSLMAYDFHIDDTVEWNWGNGTGLSKIIERFTSEVTRTIDGTEVKRTASEDEPAYLIEQEDGRRVLKSSTELTRGAIDHPVHESALCAAGVASTRCHGHG